MPVGKWKNRGASRRYSAASTIQAAARKRAFTKARGGLKTVKAIQRKPFVPKIVKNTASIATLSAAVKQLQNSKLGEFQKRTETFVWTSGSDLSSIPFDSARPLCFNLNGFTDRDYDNGAQARTMMYRTNLDGTGISAKRFEDWVAPYEITNLSVNAHWGDDDQVSKECYKPLGTKVTFEFEIGSVAAGSTTHWIRIDIDKPRKMLNISTQHHLKMPTGIGQFAKLTEQYMLNRNFINKTYWEVKKTIFIPIKNDSGVTKQINLQRTISRSYKNAKPFRPDLNASQAVADKYAPFHDVVDPRDIEWCLISHNLGSNNFNRMSILRHTSWRDQNGTSA